MPLETDYRKLFDAQRQIKKQLKILCQDLDDRPGIYFWFREDHEGKHIYIGQALSLIERNINHVQGYKQRLDKSIKKRGFYGENNKSGWKLKIMHAEVGQLNELEKYYINKYKELGYDLYNIESGSKVDKYDIGYRQAAKGYHDGLHQGYKNAQREVAHWFDKSLDFSIKGSPNKNKEKAFEKFTNFIAIENNEDNKKEGEE